MGSSFIFQRLTCKRSQNMCEGCGSWRNQCHSTCLHSLWNNGHQMRSNYRTNWNSTANEYGSANWGSHHLGHWSGLNCEIEQQRWVNFVFEEFGILVFGNMDDLSIWIIDVPFDRNHFHDFDLFLDGNHLDSLLRDDFFLVLNDPLNWNINGSGDFPRDFIVNLPLLETLNFPLDWDFLDVLSVLEVHHFSFIG